MKKVAPVIGIGLMAVLIGLVLAIQILTTSGSDQGGLVPLAKLKNYEVSLKEVREEKEQAMAELAAMQERLNTIEGEIATDDEIIGGLLADLDKYKMLAGIVDVQGPGVIITVNDPIVLDEYMGAVSVINDNYELLLSLVNKLKEAGAEAISINENRIVNTTEISLAANNININGNATAPPYYIKAIGDPVTIDNALNIRGGVIDVMKSSYNLLVELKQEEEIVIPRFSGVTKFRYAETVAEKEE